MTIINNIHNDSFHNMRLLIDPWKGKVTQLVTDPSLGDLKLNKNINLDFSTNDLNSFLNKNSDYIHQKYQWIYYYLTKDDVSNFFSKYYLTIKKDLENADKKEFYFLKFMDTDRDDTSYINQFNYAQKKLDSNKQMIKRILETIPNSNWNEANVGLNIVLNDFTPLSNIKFYFEKSTIPKWIGIDENYNNILDKDEPIFYNSEEMNEISLPIILYSNRVKKSKMDTRIDTDKKIDVGKTYFRLITENNFRPKKIESENFFTKKKFEIKKNLAKDYVKKNKFNKIIYLDSHQDNNKINFSGEVLVNEDLILDKEVVIQPGTIFSIAPGKNIIFKKKIFAKGKKDKPIIFQKYPKNNINGSETNPWGTVALLGQKSSGSILEYTYFTGGSGGNYNQFRFTSMLSIHDTSNIKINNCIFLLTRFMMTLFMLSIQKTCI